MNTYIQVYEYQEMEAGYHNWFKEENVLKITNTSTNVCQILACVSQNTGAHNPMWVEA